MMNRLGLASVLIFGLFACAEARAAEAERKATDEPEPTKTFFFTNVEGGLENIHLTTFNASSDPVFVGFAPTDALGPMVGLGAGVRLVFLTLGARARLASFPTDTSATSGMQLWNVDGELGFRIPLRRWEPYLTFAAGYAGLDGIADRVRGLHGLSARGADARLGFGVDWFLSRHFSVGANLTGGLLFLTRPGVSLVDLATAKEVGTLDEARARVLQADGSSAGTFVTGTLGLSGHF